MLHPLQDIAGAQKDFVLGKQLRSTSLKLVYRSLHGSSVFTIVYFVEGSPNIPRVFYSIFQAGG